MTPDNQSAASEGRIWAVLSRWESADVHAAVAGLRRDERRQLAALAHVPVSVLERDAAAARVLRRRVRNRAMEMREAAALLVGPVQDLVVAAWGDERSDDPSVDDLLEVLPAAVEAHGSRMTALLLALAVDAKWNAAAVCRTILDTDSRFALDALGPVADDV